MSWPGICFWFSSLFLSSSNRNRVLPSANFLGTRATIELLRYTFFWRFFFLNDGGSSTQKSSENYVIFVLHCVILVVYLGRGIFHPVYTCSSFFLSKISFWVKTCRVLSSQNWGNLKKSGAPLSRHASWTGCSHGYLQSLYTRLHSPPAQGFSFPTFSVFIDLLFDFRRI